MPVSTPKNINDPCYQIQLIPIIKPKFVHKGNDQPYGKFADMFGANNLREEGIITKYFRGPVYYSL